MNLVFLLLLKRLDGVVISLNAITSIVFKIFLLTTGSPPNNDNTL